MTCSFKVKVEDTTNPIISGCPADIEVGTGPDRATCDKEVMWVEPLSTDNCAIANAVPGALSFHTMLVIQLGTLLGAPLVLL